MLVHSLFHGWHILASFARCLFEIFLGRLEEFELFIFLIRDDGQIGIIGEFRRPRPKGGIIRRDGGKTQFPLSTGGRHGGLDRQDLVGDPMVAFTKFRDPKPPNRPILVGNFNDGSNLSGCRSRFKDGRGHLSRRGLVKLQVTKKSPRLGERAGQDGGFRLRDARRDLGGFFDFSHCCCLGKQERRREVSLLLQTQSLGSCAAVCGTQKKQDLRCFWRGTSSILLTVPNPTRMKTITVTFLEVMKSTSISPL